jgi:diaminopimelate decarboxylase
MILLPGQSVNERGHLAIGGCDVTELAVSFGTPLYVFDEAAIRERCGAYREAFESRYPTVRVEYAGKAFLCLAMARLAAEEGLNLDVASAGELYTALRSGFPAERIVMHGNNKSAAELQLALQAGVGRIVVDNLEEIAALAGLAAARGSPQEVLVRVAPGVDPHTHRRIQTGQADTKFGLNAASGAALEGVRRVLAQPGLIFTGLHSHIGSNLHDATAHLAALEAVLDVAVDVRRETGLAMEELNLGGGLGIRYTANDAPVTVADFAEVLVGRLMSGLAERHLPLPVLSVEPGRSIVGEAGTTLYTVGAIKDVPTAAPPGFRRYVSIDGGMSDNPRPQLYDAVYSALVANKAAQPASVAVRIAGKHCETDILIQDTMIQEVEAGDILAVLATGAYTHSMASNYNRLPRPAAVFVRDGTSRLVSRRETLEDLVRLDVPPE